MTRHLRLPAVATVAVVALGAATAWGQNAPAADASAGGSVSLGLGGTTADGATAAATTTGEPAAAEPVPVEPVAQPAPPPPPPPVAAPPPPPPAPVEDGTDHDKAVGAWGIGLLGTQRLTMLGRPGGAGQFNVGMPVVGVRHWVTERYGFQAGIGLNAAGGTIKDNEPGAHDDPNPTTIAMGLHAAAPISLYHDKSYNLLILPGLDFAFGDSRLQDDPDAAGDQATVQKSVLLQASVRAGAEVQFGFIGMPMLSLQGTVGAALGWTNSGIEYTEGGQGRKRNASLWAIGTQNYDEPWDLFVGSIAAVYYFK